MHPRTAELLDHLERQRARLFAAVDAVPAALRERSPAVGRWSCAQVLEHLGTVERQVAALLRRELRGAVTAGLGPETETSPVLPMLDAERLLDRERRLQAPGRAGAFEGLDAAAARAQLQQTRAQLLEVLREADGLAVGSIRAPHPLLGELDFHQWMAFTGFHEARHAAQIDEVARALATG